MNDSYCEIDPDTVDQWGIPVLRFHWQWSDNEIKMARDMQETFRDIVETAGGTYYWQVRPDGDHPYGIEDGGVIIHEIGTVRMGAQPKTSVLNGYCQAHDVKNLFVTDGGFIRKQCGQESDADHHGIVMAGFGLFAGSSEERKSVIRLP